MGLVLCGPTTSMFEPSCGFRFSEVIYNIHRAERFGLSRSRIPVTVALNRLNRIYRTLTAQMYARRFLLSIATPGFYSYTEWYPELQSASTPKVSWLPPNYGLNWPTPLNSTAAHIFSFDQTTVASPFQSATERISLLDSTSGA
jgi:hypothetical protein